MTFHKTDQMFYKSKFQLKKNNKKLKTDTFFKKSIVHKHCLKSVFPKNVKNLGNKKVNAYRKLL